MLVFDDWNCLISGPLFNAKRPAHGNSIWQYVDLLNVKFQNKIKYALWSLDYSGVHFVAAGCKAPGFE